MISLMSGPQAQTALCYHILLNIPTFIYRKIFEIATLRIHHRYSLNTSLLIRLFQVP